MLSRRGARTRLQAYPRARTPSEQQCWHLERIAEEKEVGLLSPISSVSPLFAIRSRYAILYNISRQGVTHVSRYTVHRNSGPTHCHSCEQMEAAPHGSRITGICAWWSLDDEQQSEFKSL